MFHAGFIVAGLMLLVVGGELLLRGAVGLATWCKLTPAVIGLTIVAAATSVPELAVTFIAAAQNRTELAVGNVVGSNICNIGLILGISALVSGLRITGNAIKLEYPVMALVSLLLVVVCQDGQISRLESILFLLIYFCFTLYLIRLVRGQLKSDDRKGLSDEVKTFDGTKHPLSKSIALTCIAIVLLAFGAQLTVDGAVGIARSIGLSERVIGLTIVAIGTSLPEIVASLISSIRGRDDVAIGNVIGSNIFNILIILGASGLVNPIIVGPGIVHSDLWWMLGITLVLFPLMFSGKLITRKEGVLLLTIYGAYLVILLQS